MVCDVEESAATELWPALLEFRRFLAPPPSPPPSHATFFRCHGAWRFAPPSELLPRNASARLVVPLDAGVEARVLQAAAGIPGDVTAFLYARHRLGKDPFVSLTGTLDAASKTIFRIYLPLLVGGYLARNAGEVFVTAHLAQTLDGRIACRNGQSHWISNEANLRHAHRLRALHDAVVVGGRTVTNDDPALTVRHVAGEDPTRIVLNGSGSILREDRDFQVFGGAGSTLLCHASSLEGFVANGRHGRVRVVPIDCPTKPLMAPSTIATALRERGLHTAFIEGGGLTLSNYLEHRALDVLYIHIAPLILGSGIHGLSLPEVSTVQAGRHVRMEPFAMDGELLLECRDVKNHGEH